MIVASGLIAAVYGWRVIEAAYFTDAPEGRAEVAEAPLSMLVPLWLLTGLCVLLALNAEWTMTLAEEAARALMNGAAAGVVP